MKAPLKWLKDYVDIALPGAEIARRLTMAGMEVKDVKVIGGTWQNVFIGQIKAVNPHPNADRLRLATVSLGTSEETVVCGAPNLNVGDKIAFARVGAELKDGHTGQTVKLKPAKIRGVLSAGMCVSEMELGVSDNHEGILILPPDAPLGTPLADYMGDTIFDLDVTPNRADCLSVIGIAHEVAALTGQPAHITEPAYAEAGPSIEDKISVAIDCQALCSRYCASLITDVKIAESPKWIQNRLLACGMRPINNIVDVTNYVMLEYGQPLHSFDYERLRGKKIIVRRANDGEYIISLDGQERKLSPDMLVIADETRPVAVAGVMGGANSEVTEGTTSILLESANFNAVSIHYTSRQLNLVSEASIRFERGIRPGLTIPALKRATQLIVELGGGKAAAGIADVYPGKRDPAPILLSTQAVKRVLGVDFSLDRIVTILTSLGFECRTTSATEVMVTAPYWRSDINQAVDLIEEVARITGYDAIPMTLLSQPLPPQNPAPVIGFERRLREYIADCGFQEVITYSLTSLDMLKKTTPEPRDMKTMRLFNPMTADQEYFRPDLRANLLNTLRENRRHEDGGLRIFELDKVYIPRPKDLPEEPEILCGILSGNRLEKSWLADAASFDFFDAKGMVESIFSQFGIEAGFAAGNDPGLHPAKQAAVIAGGKPIGVIGEIHPKVLDAFEITGPVCLFELNVTALASLVGHKMYQPVPRFPSVVRDIALVVDANVSHLTILNIIKSFPLVSQVALFDVYSGGQVAAGKKSLAYRIVYLSPDHTLTDDEVNGVQQQVLAKLAAELGAVLRA